MLLGAETCAGLDMIAAGHVTGDVLHTGPGLLVRAVVQGTVDILLTAHNLLVGAS